MKKIIAVLLILAAGTAAFANGTQEEENDNVVELRRGERAGEERLNFLEDLEKVELSGVVKFESPVPELVSGGSDYTLMAPGVREYLDYINEGDSISVTGYIIDEGSMPGPGGRRMEGRGIQREFEALEGNEVIFIESVTVDGGTTYELPWVNEDFDGREGRDGRRPDMKDRRDGRRG